MTFCQHIVFDTIVTTVRHQGWPIEKITVKYIDSNLALIVIDISACRVWQSASVPAL